MRDAKPTPRSLPLLARRLDSSRVGTYMPCLPGVVIRRGRHRARSMTGKTSKGPKELQRECQGGVRPAPWAGVPDRKSTRLNSSHSQISYAVFCLKKKKSTCRTRLYGLVCVDLRELRQSRLSFPVLWLSASASLYT